MPVYGCGAEKFRAQPLAGTVIFAVEEQFQTELNRTGNRTLIISEKRGGNVMVTDLGLGFCYGDNDSAITLAISQVKQGNIEFRGEKRYDISEETFGVLSFDSNEDEPYSTNNLTGTSVVMGWNQTPVPPRFCHLVGVGTHRGLVVVREAFVKDPPFPYSLASAGQIVGESLEVFSVESGVPMPINLFG